MRRRTGHPANHRPPRCRSFRPAPARPGATVSKSGSGWSGHAAALSLHLDHALLEKLLQGALDGPAIVSQDERKRCRADPGHQVAGAGKRRFVGTEQQRCPDPAALLTDAGGNVQDLHEDRTKHVEGRPLAIVRTHDPSFPAPGAALSNRIGEEIKAPPHAGRAGRGCERRQRRSWIRTRCCAHFPPRSGWLFSGAWRAYFSLAEDGKRLARRRQCGALAGLTSSSRASGAAARTAAPILVTPAPPAGADRRAAHERGHSAPRAAPSRLGTARSLCFSG